MNYTTEGNDKVPTLPYSIQILNGKAAVFVRGIIDHMGEKPMADLPLRKCQEAGMRAVDELGDSISVPYVSKLTKMLESCGVLLKERKGKGYVLNPGLNFYEVHSYIQGSPFGVAIEREASDDDIRMRSAMLDHMNDVGSVRIESEHPLDRRAYQVLIEKFKSGAYDMVFVQRDVALRMEDEHNELGYHVETLRSSVTIQK